MKATFNNVQCNPSQRQGRVDTMTRSDLPQILREVLGAIVMVTGLVVATAALFSL